MSAFSNSALMGEALDAEVARLERSVATAGVVLCLVGVVLSVYITFALFRSLGLLILSLSIGLLAWFLFVRVCLDRGMGSRIFQWTNPLVEVSLPTILLLIDLHSQGPRYAVAQPVPLELYGIFIAISILRLRPWVPAVVGLFAAIQYLVIQSIWVLPFLPPALAQEPAFQPGMIVIRGVFLMLAGGAGFLISRTLRQAVRTAAVVVRSKDLFGKYRLNSELARGGMGVVFRATYCPEGGFQRPVALKRIHPSLAKDESFVSRFRNEAELCSRLVHPNIVQVIDFGKVEDTYFFAMEFVDGVTALELVLRARAATAAIPARLVAWIGREVCKGLAFAHEEARDPSGGLLRVVHRDLNLPNILISRSGAVKLLDFGIAHAIGEVQQSIPGQAVGKLAYVAPEQLEQAPVDTRADLFSAGVVIWELLCLQPLFSRESQIATIGAVMAAAIPPPSTIRTDLKSPLWDLFLEEALQRSPEKRFRHASEMVEVLDNILELEGYPRPEELALYLETLPLFSHSPKLLTSTSTGVEGVFAEQRP